MPRQTVAFPGPLHAAITVEMERTGLMFGAQVVLLLSEALAARGIKTEPLRVQTGAKRTKLHQTAPDSTTLHQNAPKRTKTHQTAPLNELWQSEIPWVPVTEENLKEFLTLGDAALVEKAIKLTSERIPLERRRNAVGYCRKVLTNWKIAREQEEEKARTAESAEDEIRARQAEAEAAARSIGWGEEE